MKLNVFDTVHETIAQDYRDEVLVLPLDETSFELELNRSSNEAEFIDVEYNKVIGLYATSDEPQTRNTNFEPFGAAFL